MGLRGTGLLINNHHKTFKYFRHFTEGCHTILKEAHLGAIAGIIRVG